MYLCICIRICFSVFVYLTDNTFQHSHNGYLFIRQRKTPQTKHYVPFVRQNPKLKTLGNHLTWCNVQCVALFNNWINPMYVPLLNTELLTSLRTWINKWGHPLQMLPQSFHKHRVCDLGVAWRLVLITGKLKPRQIVLISATSHLGATIKFRF